MKITEEILVVGKAPKAQPVSTVTTIADTLIDQYKPRDLSEAIRYAPGRERHDRQQTRSHA